MASLWASSSVPPPFCIHPLHYGQSSPSKFHSKDIILLLKTLQWLTCPQNEVQVPQALCLVLPYLLPHPLQNLVLKLFVQHTTAGPGSSSLWVFPAQLLYALSPPAALPAWDYPLPFIIQRWDFFHFGTFPDHITPPPLITKQLMPSSLSHL